MSDLATRRADADDPTLRTLTDSALSQIVRSRYEAMMLLEVNGAQYSTPQGSHMARMAAQDYWAARAEQERRKVVLVPVCGDVNGEE